MSGIMAWTFLSDFLNVRATGAAFMLPVSGSREVFFDQPHDDAVRQKKRAWRSGMTRNTADSDSYGNKGVNDD